MKLILLWLFCLMTMPAFATQISIDNDEDDCKAARISMDVTVKVDGESFDFDPSCEFSFNKDFKTKSGLSCQAQAGMCSSFSPRNRFEVSCEDGSREGVVIECEKRKTGSSKDKKCTSDGQCCAHWTASGACAHEYSCGDCW
jgi:hypothetical protein